MTTSVSAGSAIPTSRDGETGLASRVLGVVRAPRRTLAAVAAAPRYADVLLLSMVATASAGALLFLTGVGQLALLDFGERTAVAFGWSVDDARYAAMAAAASRYGALYALIVAVVTGPLTAVALAAVVFGGLRAAPGRAPSYRQVLAIAAHAGIILALRQVVAAPIGYARETLASPASMSLFFTMLDEGSLAARLFGMVDLFLIWWLLVLAVGLSVVYGLPARRLALLGVGAYLACALALAAIMAMAGGVA